MVLRRSCNIFTSICSEVILEYKTVVLEGLISVTGLKLEAKCLSLNFMEREYFSGTDFGELVLENIKWT